MSDNAQNTNTITTPVEDFLRGCVGYDVTDEALNTILIGRRINAGTPVSELSKRQLDLCRADAYMWCTTIPSTSGSVEDADAGWKHKEGGSQKSSSDNSRLISMANSIYNMYGELTVGSSIRISSRGMRLWPRRR